MQSSVIYIRTVMTGNGHHYTIQRVHSQTTYFIRDRIIFGHILIQGITDDQCATECAIVATRMRTFGHIVQSLITMTTHQTFLCNTRDLLNLAVIDHTSCFAGKDYRLRQNGQMTINRTKSIVHSTQHSNIRDNGISAHCRRLSGSGAVTRSTTNY